MSKRILVQNSREIARKAQEEGVYNLILDVGDDSAVVVHGFTPLDNTQANVDVTVVTLIGFMDDEEDGEKVILDG